MSEDLNSSSVVQIDENKLDKECIRLPSSYLQYAHKAAEAKRDVMELKAELEVVEADLGRRIRDTPGKYGLEKITEAAVAGVILLQPSYQEKLKELHSAQHAQEMAQAVVNALEHKKRSLTLLVELHGMGWFSAPKVSDKGKEAVREMMKKGVYRRHNDD